MSIEFKQSRNGQNTCSKDGFSLHSGFNPEQEAERFVSSIDFSSAPAFIIVVGACLSYCAKYFKTKLPETHLISIQFDRAFSEQASCWDTQLYFDSRTQADLFAEKIFQLIGEENLFKTKFISWKPSENAWPELSKSVWGSLKTALNKADAVLNTRNYFNRRWFFNTVRFCSLYRTANNRLADLLNSKRFHKPVLVTASGPTLTNSIPLIKKQRDNFVILAVSSSISYLLANGILPDFCISTDGGYYAKKHFDSFLRNSKTKDIPVFLSAESAVPSLLFRRNPVIPLSYNDSFEKMIFPYCKIHSVKAERNGSVSGTALILAAQLTESNVYFCGLDLAAEKSTGFQHAKPNELENCNSSKDFRLNPTENRISGGFCRKNDSLSIYRNWFINKKASFSGRFFRLFTREDSRYLEKYSFGSDTDIFWEDLQIKEKTAAQTEVFDITQAAKTEAFSISGAAQTEDSHITQAACKTEGTYITESARTEVADIKKAACKTEGTESLSSAKVPADILKAEKDRLLQNIKIGSITENDLFWYKTADLKLFVQSNKSIDELNIPEELQNKTTAMIDKAIDLSVKLISHENSIDL